MCGLSIPIGTVISFLMSGLIFKDQSTMKEDTKHLILIQNIWVTVCAVPFIILVRDKPTHPPSAVATQNKPQTSLIPIFKEALQDRNYVYLLVIFALIDGEFISFSSIMSLLFDHYKTPSGAAVYGTSLISLYGGSTAIFGVAASIACGVML